MWLQLKRTFKTSLENFTHNIWLAVATVSVIAVALFIINIQIANIVANNLLLEDTRDKINVSLYLKEDVTENDGHEIEQSLKNYPEIERVSYISRDDVLKSFNDSTSGDKILKEAMDVLGENPFGIVINIKAHNPDDYSVISDKIKKADFYDKVENINYKEHEGIITSLNNEIKSSQKMAMVLGSILSAIAILVTFNTIRITIYTHRKEIEIMKLVGASNSYVTAPFVWEGVWYGVVAAIIAIGASYGYFYFIISNSANDTLLSLSSAKFIKQFLTVYFMQNIVLIIIAQFVAGIVLGVVSSLITIIKYLKV